MKNLITNYTFLTLFILTAIIVAQSETDRVVRVTPGYATVVVCPVAPELVTAGNVDDFSVQSAGNYVLIKPLVSSGTTNMFIKAGRDSYNLILQVSDTPDMEVRLPSTRETLDQLSTNGTNDHDEAASAQLEKSKSILMVSETNSAAPKPISSLNSKALEELSNKYKATNKFAYSVNNSNVTFAIDYLKQFKDKLLVIGTIINNSNIPYDIGFVSFNRIDYKKSFALFRKKIKETEMEPTELYYDETIPPHSSGRLLFVFEKHGFSFNSNLKIKCNEESGQRDLELEVPGSIVK